MSDLVGGSVTTVPVSDSWWAAARSPGERRDGQAGEPDWVRFLAGALAAAPEDGPPLAGAPPAGGERDLGHPLRPLFDAAGQLFDVGIGAVPTGAGVDRAAVWAHVREWLADRLVGLAGRTLVRELRLARDANTLLGATGRDRFLDYLRRAASRAELTGLLHRHPVLARLLAESCLHTADAAAELVRRFADDRAALVATLLAGRDPGTLTGVCFGRGDLHGGGRSVAMLRFSDGATVVYKPRPLGLHARWNELLAWFGALRPDLAVRAVAVLPGEGYGWAEFVPALPCGSAAEVELFYRRQGGLLALLYALDATDIHCENLIACGDQPVAVDMETLFHPDWLPETDGGHDPALAALNRSVMRIALLPRMLLGEHGALDMSGLGGDRGTDYPTDLSGWADAGTDAMRLVRKQMPFAGAANRPALGGRPVDPIDYRASLLSGFRAGYDAIVEHAGELLAEDGPLAAFAGEQIRLVMRNTQTYAALLDSATDPDLLADGLDREFAFDALRADTGHAHLATLLPHELRELYAGDVPMFTARAGDRDVRTGTGVLLPRLLRASGIEAAAAKVRRMGASDLRDQEWLVRATLATRVPAAGHGGLGAAPGPVASVVPDQQRILALAAGIGDDLLARSFQDLDRTNWLGLELVDGRHWTVLPMGAGLAEGYCGTALFLAQLGRLTGTARYLELASRAVCRLPRLIAVLAEQPELARAVGSGGFFGIGGICYALARLANLLDDAALLRLLPDALLAAANADTPGRTNLAEGTAGAFAAVSSVYVETGLPEAGSLAASLADRLRDRPLPTESGFLSGRTGVDWALGRFAGADWTNPAIPSFLDTGGDLSWCSGPAGELLARCADRLPGAAGEPAVAAFADELTGRPPSADLSLCHGQLGRVEPLVELASRGYSPAVPAIARVTAQILGVIERYGVGCGTPHAVPTPGLLTGVAGIGYGLLRLGFGEQVPSVLLLRPTTPDETPGAPTQPRHRNENC